MFKPSITSSISIRAAPKSSLTLGLVGFLSDEENSALNEPISWKEATQKILGASGSNEQDLLAAINSKASFKDDSQKEQLLAGLKWIGLVGYACSYAFLMRRKF